ncbi:MAG TPA: outer membrane lipoprotein carrier protein LolA [Myxococcota bacterium]|nr:outer membrane lipoprotein carrier protein LolA [Myxococcota bacterium]
MRPRAWLALAACAAALGAAAAQWDVTTLFEALARERPGRATFEEKRYLALLDRPLVSTGELSFTPPARLEKRTVAPRPERMVVDGERVTIERAGKTLSLGLGENPAIAVLVESIRGTLAGDLASVTRTYSAALDGTRARWRLLLRPLDPAAAALVERVEIAGAEARVESVAIFHADGDRSVMTIAPDPAR